MPTLAELQTPEDRKKFAKHVAEGSELMQKQGSFFNENDIVLYF